MPPQTPKRSTYDAALWAALPMAQTSKVEGRLRLILNRSRNRRALTRRAWSLAVVLALGTVLTIATAQTAGTTPPDTPLPPPDVKTLHYAVADLGDSFGDVFFSENYLNDHGEVFGVLEPENTPLGKEIVGQTGIWDAKQHWTPLLLNRGETRIDPSAFNAQGQFIGQSSYRHSLPHWIVGDRSRHVYFRDMAAFRQLGATRGATSELKAINDAGEIVINSDQKTSHGHAFLWQNNHLTPLKPLPGSVAVVESLNNSGWAVGSSNGHAVLWKDSNLPIDLGVLPGYDGGMGTKINASGDVAGTLYHVKEWLHPGFVDQLFHAFFWHEGKMEEIGPLPGFQYAEPMGINDARQVVGWAYSILPEHYSPHTNSYSTPSTAFLWQQGKIYDLQQFLPAGSEWHILRADGINDRGQILAVAINLSLLSRRRWSQRTILLTPTP